MSSRFEEQSLKCQTARVRFASFGILVCIGCSTTDSLNAASGGMAPTAGHKATGGTSTSSNGGSDIATGGSPLTGGSSTGGTANSGGTPDIGGGAQTGGNNTVGGSSGLGGTTSSGGAIDTGGSRSSTAGANSGASNTTGGRTSTGGTEASGGMHTGGAPGIGGSSGAAGANGTGGHVGTGGTTGTTAFNPCPTNGNACKILPFGDSITRGVKSTDDAGYRSPLFKLIVAAKQKATFTGSLTNGPTQVSGQTFPRTHEGHAGWTIDPGYNTSGNYGGISSLIPSPAFDGNPNIILLHIGTNDLFFKDSVNMPTRLDTLLDKTAQNAPNALIVLAQITPCNSVNPATYNSKIPGIILSHTAKGQHIVGVDMSKMPLTDLSSDGTHPNDQGYAYMANIWYAAIKDLLPK